MPCYWPIPAYQSQNGRPLLLWPPVELTNLSIPCSKCIGCRAQRATTWAQRCSHEADTWDSNIFLTLTYDDEHLPKNAELQPRHLQLFWKKVRKNATGHLRDPHRNVRLTRGGKESKRQHRPIRYFACGEYGELRGRPHYHAIVFNLAVPDATHVSYRNDQPTYTSALLTRLWGKGTIEFGPFTPDAACYIAQYQLAADKLPRELQPKTIAEHRLRESGRLRTPQKPFLRMSNGIGRDWFDTYWKDLVPGYLQTHEFKANVPRYYRERMKTRHPDMHERMLWNQERHRQESPSDRNTAERLRDAEIIHLQKHGLKEWRELE